jgi:hypothetical protein
VLTATIAVPAVGTYSVVALASDAPLPVPGGRLDDDVAAAVKAGATYVIEPMVVQ